MGESGFVPVSGGKLHYEVEGSGHPLLLIHCGLTDLRQWDPQVPALAERYRVIRYDTRGYGLSETDDVEFRDRDDLIAVLDHVGAERTYLLGHSRGGMIGLDALIEHPDRFDAFIHEASGVTGFKANVPEGQRPPYAEMEQLWEAKDWDALAELETRVWVDGWGQPSTRVDPAIRRKVRDWIVATYRQEKVEGKPQGMKPPAAERLGEVRLPTLVMIGLVDEPGGVQAGRHFAASVETARLVEFPGVAHMIDLEEPDRWRQFVIGFLSELGR